MPVIQTHYDRKQWIRIVTVLYVVLLNTKVLNARPPKIGVLAAESRFQDMGPHNQAAWKTAATQGQATLIL